MLNRYLLIVGSCISVIVVATFSFSLVVAALRLPFAFHLLAISALTIIVALKSVGWIALAPADVAILAIAGAVLFGNLTISAVLAPSKPPTLYPEDRHE